MNKEEVFKIWAPEESLWSQWTKPVLFAHLDTPSWDASETADADVACDAHWAPPAAEKTALVLDLPGADGVLAGLALAARGYWPVPLYNAVPLPSPASYTNQMVAAVNVLPIIRALRNGAEQLAAIHIPSDAPPAFLLDANRQGDGRKMQPDAFDNRSICFTTDFPSGIYLAGHGIQHVLFVQKQRALIPADLAHLLRRWQDAGFRLERLRLDSPHNREPFEVSRPSWYGMMFQRALSALGLYRAKGGGFGDWVPDSSAVG